MAEALAPAIKGLSLEQNYLLVAAIDFGTTFSGYAFSFKTKPNDIKMNKNWGAVLSCESYKAPTCVMTKPNGSFHSFGYEAEHEFSELNPAKKKIGGPKGYNLYRNFKMLLHNQVVNMKSTVFSSSGHVTKAVDIFTMVLNYLKGHLLDALNKTLKVAPKSSDVRWVLTVPAIWTDDSKDFMREAAYRAGLIPIKNSTNLLFALEPEAASTFCRSLEVTSLATTDLDSNEDLTFRSGDKILIIDAGGGTVDIAAHELLLDGKVKEITAPSGGPWGGIKVDQNFVLLLENTFSTDFINKFKADQPQQWLQFMTAFERAKKGFKPDGNCSIKVAMPYSFGTDFKKFAKQDIEKVSKKARDKGLAVNNGYITVNNDRANSLFSQPIGQITEHVKALQSDKNLASLNYVLFVGGFGESKVLQDACKAILPEGVKILVPVDAQLAVIRGAVLFGHDPLNICSRIARFTYGVGIHVPFEEGKHNAKKSFIDRKGKRMCSDLFSTLVMKGDRVENGESKERNYVVGDLSKGLLIVIFQSDKPDVTYVDEPGVKELGRTTLQKCTSHDVKLTITFGHTELLIEAREIKGKKNCPVQMTVDFMAN